MGSTPNSRYELCYLDGRQSVAGGPPVHDSMSDPLVPPTASTESPWLVWGRCVFALTIVAILLAPGVANIGTRARWHEVEDGVLWAGRAEGVTALEVARGSAADAAGIHRGDVLLAVNGSPVQTPADVVEFQHRGHEGTRLAYTLLRLGTQQALEVSLAPAPRAGWLAPLIYGPALVLGAARVFAVVRGSSQGELLSSAINVLDRAEQLYLFACAVAALGVLVRAFRDITAVTARRQLRWIARG